MFYALYFLNFGFKIKIFFNFSHNNYWLSIHLWELSLKNSVEIIVIFYFSTQDTARTSSFCRFQMIQLQLWIIYEIAWSVIIIKCISTTKNVTRPSNLMHYIRNILCEWFRSRCFVVVIISPSYAIIAWMLIQKFVMR